MDLCLLTGNFLLIWQFNYGYVVIALVNENILQLWLISTMVISVFF